MLTERRLAQRRANDCLLGAVLLSIMSFALIRSADGLDDGPSYRSLAPRVSETLEAIEEVSDLLEQQPDALPEQQGAALRDVLTEATTEFTQLFFTQSTQDVVALESERDRLELQRLVLGVARGVSFCGLALLVPAWYWFVRARSRKAQGARSPEALSQLQSDLGTLVGQIETAAASVITEAQSQQTAKADLEARVEELRAYVSVTEPQARAIDKRIRPSVRLGILGFVATLVGLLVTLYVALRDSQEPTPVTPPTMTIPVAPSSTTPGG